MDRKELVEFMKENEKVEQVYFEGLKEKTISSKFQYIKEHFTYYIINSWNGLKTVGNNVKIWNLQLTDKQRDRFFEIIDIDNDYIYDNLGFNLQEFEDLTNMEVCFNGRCGGYLIISPKFETYSKTTSIMDMFFSDDIYQFKDYAEFKKDSLDIEYLENDMKMLDEKIEDCYYLIKAFDKLCDILRTELIYLLDNAKIEEEIETIEITNKYITLGE